ncbi:MAG: hypothetical protein QXR77_03245 [Archaeoglobaceae archaeon]
MWTEASVERLNHLGKNMVFLIREIKNFIPEGRLIVSLGVNFLPLYGYEISRAVEALTFSMKGGITVVSDNLDMR